MVSLSFINCTNLFNMQDPKVRININKIRGPARVDINVANQGEWLNHPSNHPCCDSKYFFLWASLSEFGHGFPDLPRCGRRKSSILLLRQHIGPLL